MTKAAPIVSVSNLTKRFGNVEALRGADLDIDPGVFGLIGPNGAGKTTLFRILLGLIRKDGGQATVLGMDVQKDSLKIRRKLGVLHERPSYPRFMTPVQYLNHVSSFYGSGRRADELLKTVGLENAKNRHIQGLSAGMLQRLGIAQSLAGNPSIVLLDEPTSNLDVTGRNEVIQLITRLHEETGTSFIISSHVLSEMDKLCQSVAFIKSGQIVEKGEIFGLLEKHTSDRFRVGCSDQRKLMEALERTPHVTAISPSGVNRVLFSIAGATLSDVWTLMNQVAKEYGIEIFGVEKASTLEEVYKDVVENA